MPKLTKIELLIAFVAAGVAGFYFYDIIIDNLLAIFTLGGLGGAAAVAAKERAKEAQIVADEHEQLGQYDLEKSNTIANEGVEAHQNAVDIAENVTDPNYNNLPPGFKKKSIKSE